LETKLNRYRAETEALSDRIRREVTSFDNIKDKCEDLSTKASTWVDKTTKYNDSVVNVYELFNAITEVSETKMEEFVMYQDEKVELETLSLLSKQLYEGLLKKE